MPEFILDKGDAEHARAFNALDAFTRGYIEALYFTSCEPGTEHGEFIGHGNQWEPDTMSALPGDVGFSDLAPEALARIIADCAAFQASASLLLDQAYARDYDAEQAGRDFWYTRNGHGVGYWDREQLEGPQQLGALLSQRARAYGGCDAYLGDDGLVYV